jgi:hypothetical protein
MPLPLSAAQRALQARQSRTLSQAANFDPMFRQKLMQDVSQPTPTPMQAPVAGPVAGPVAPGNYPLTVQGPGQQLPPSVMTAPDLSRRVNIEGQSAVLPSQINTTNSQTARPQQTPQQMALQKTQEIVNQQTPKPVVQQPVVPAVSKPIVRQQKAPVEPQATIRPSDVINKEVTDLDNQMTSLRDIAIEDGLKPDTPAGQAYYNQIMEMSKRINVLQEELDIAVKAEKSLARQQKKTPSNVSQMIVPKEQIPSGISSLSKGTTGEIYPSKDAYDKAMIFKTLQEDVPRASYIEGDKLITVYPQNIPKDLMRNAGVSPMATIIRDAKTGKVIKD